MKADTTYAGNHLSYIPIHKSTISYRKGDYRNISKLSISIYDDRENLINNPTFEYLDPNCPQEHNGGNNVTRTFVIQDEIDAIKKQISENNFEDPYSDKNSSAIILKRVSHLEELKKKYQMQITIDVKVIENGINTETNFN